MRRSRFIKGGKPPPYIPAVPFLFATTFAIAIPPSEARAQFEDLAPIEIRTTPNNDPAAVLYDPSVTTIEIDDLRLKDRATVEEALRYVPGLDVSRSGGPGQQTSVFIRGARSEDTLVLIDGVEVNDPTGPARAFDFANLLASNIERIEVYRGPQGVRFGPGATGGVINIVTKRGSESRESQIGVRYGSFNTRAGDARTSGKIGRFDYSLSASGLRSDGFSAASEAEGATEKDGVRISSLSSRLGFRTQRGLDVDATIRLSNNHSDLDRGGGVLNDDPNYTSQFQQIATGLTMMLPIAGGKSRAGYYFAEMKRSGENFADPASADTSFDKFDGRIHKFDLAYDRKLTRTSSLLVSLQNKTENADSTANYSGFDVTFPNRSQSLNTAGATYAFDNKRLFGDFGVRYDANSRLTSRVNYRIAAGRRFDEGSTVLQAAIGTALKIPSLFQLYSTYGDPSLQSENVTSYSVSVLRRFSHQISLDTTAFLNDYASLIDFDAASSRYRNFGDAQASGAETELIYDVGDGFTLSGSYRYLDARSTESDLRLLRRSRNAWTASAEYTRSALRLRLDYRFRDSFIDVDPGTPARIEKPSFGVLDFHASYQVNDWLESFIRIENAFDRIYQEVAGFGTPRRSGTVGLSGRF